MQVLSLESFRRVSSFASNISYQYPKPFASNSTDWSRMPVNLISHKYSSPYSLLGPLRDLFNFSLQQDEERPLLLIPSITTRATFKSRITMTIWNTLSFRPKCDQQDGCAIYKHPSTSSQHDEINTAWFLQDIQIIQKISLLSLNLILDPT